MSEAEPGTHAVLEAYSKECEALAALMVERAQEETAKGLVAFGEDLQPLRNLLVFLRFLVERRNVDAAPRALRVLYAKLIDTLSGIVSLLQAGLPGPAVVLTRSLLETAIHIRVLLGGDLAERCRLFENFILVERRKVESGNGVTDEQIAENAEALAKVRGDYHPKDPKSWCWKVVVPNGDIGSIHRNPGIRDLAEAVGYLGYYRDVYGRFSAAVHPTPAYEGWMRRSDGQIELGPKFGSNHPPIARVAASLVAHTLLRILEILAPPDRLDLSRFLLLLTARPDDQPADEDGDE